MDEIQNRIAGLTGVIAGWKVDVHAADIAQRLGPEMNDAHLPVKDWP